MLIAGTVEVCILEKEAVLLVARFQLLDECINCQTVFTFPLNDDSSIQWSALM